MNATKLNTLQAAIKRLEERFQMISGGLQDLGSVSVRAESVADAASNLADACDDLAKVVGALISEVQR